MRTRVTCTLLANAAPARFLAARAGARESAPHGPRTRRLKPSLPIAASRRPFPAALLVTTLELGLMFVRMHHNGAFVAIVFALQHGGNGLVKLAQAEFAQHGLPNDARHDILGFFRSIRRGR